MYGHLVVGIRYEQWIGSSGKGLVPLKHVVRGSIPGSCVWRKFGWEGRTHLVCPTGSPTEISHRWRRWKLRTNIMVTKKKNFYPAFFYFYPHVHLLFVLIFFLPNIEVVKMVDCAINSGEHFFIYVNYISMKNHIFSSNHIYRL
jgi:hypothetical protein